MKKLGAAVRESATARLSRTGVAICHRAKHPSSSFAPLRSEPGRNRLSLRSGPSAVSKDEAIVTVGMATCLSFAARGIELRNRRVFGIALGSFPNNRARCL